MTFPTAEDNPLVKLLDMIFAEYNSPTGFTTEEEKKFESLKQQILSEHEIVERLKEFIPKFELVFVGLNLPNKKSQEEIKFAYKEVFDNLKSILENNNAS